MPSLPPDKTATNNDRFFAAITAFVGLAYALTLLPPWIPSFLTNAEFRDPSWRYMLHEGFLHRLEFGREIIFTYGPFGFLTTRMYHPETFSLMLAIWIALSVLFFALTWTLARQFTRSPLTALLISVVAVRVVFVEAMIFLFAFLVLLIAWRIADAVREANGRAKPFAHRRLTRMLVLTVGLLPLSKYTFVPAVFFVAAVLACFDVWKRKFPWHSVGVVVGMLLAWRMSGQPFHGIVNYLSAGFEVAARYVDAMTNWETEPFDVAIVLIAFVLIPLVPFLSRIRVATDSRVQSLIYPLTLCTLLFLAFKFTFVGFHAHKAPIYFGSAFLIALYSMLATGGTFEIEKRRQLGSVCLTGTLFVVFLCSSFVRFLETPHSAMSLIAMGNPQHPTAMMAWLNGEDWMTEQHQKNFQDIRTMHPLPELRGTIDVVPDKLAIAIAHQPGRFNPRPLLHSYATHSPWLAEQNAKHYRSDAGPDNVLFRVNPLIGRFPTLNDGKLWLELIRRYDVRENLGSDLLLCRRTIDRRVELHSAAKVEIAWNESVELPAIDSGLVWCRVVMQQKTAGKLAAFAYKLPEIWMDVTQGSTVTTYRFTSASGASGFLLSPVIAQKEQLQSLLTLGTTALSSGIAVDSIGFRTSDLSQRHFYDDSITIEFHEVAVSDGGRIARTENSDRVR